MIKFIHCADVHFGMDPSIQPSLIHAFRAWQAMADAVGANARTQDDKEISS